jgi:hypothetical protein
MSEIEQEKQFPMSETELDNEVPMGEAVSPQAGHRVIGNGTTMKMFVSPSFLPT